MKMGKYNGIDTPNTHWCGSPRALSWRGLREYIACALLSFVLLYSRHFPLLTSQVQDTELGGLFLTESSCFHVLCLGEKL